MSSLVSRIQSHLPNLLKPANTPPERAAVPPSASMLSTPANGSKPYSVLRRPAWLSRRRQSGEKTVVQNEVPRTSPPETKDSGYASATSTSLSQKVDAPGQGNPGYVEEPENIQPHGPLASEVDVHDVSNRSLNPDQLLTIRMEFFSRIGVCRANVEKQLLDSIEYIDAATIATFKPDRFLLPSLKKAADNIKAVAGHELHQIQKRSDLTETDKKKLFDDLLSSFNKWLPFQEKELRVKASGKFAEVKLLQSAREAVFSTITATAQNAEKEMLEAIDTQQVMVNSKLPTALSSHANKAVDKISAAYNKAQRELGMRRGLSLSLKKILVKDIKRRQEAEEERIRQAASVKFKECNWSAGQHANIWEKEHPPLLIRKGETWNLRPTSQQLGIGGIGSVSLWNSDANHFAAKRVTAEAESKYEGVDFLKAEYQAFKEVYEKGGPHRNLVNAYGIASMQVNGVSHRMLLMDHVPGLPGDKFISKMRLSYETGKITSEEYFGALQFIFSRIAEAVEHVNKAKVVHADLKPENFIVRDDGEPVLIDMGVAQKHGSNMAVGTPGYMSTDYAVEGGLKETSDVYSLAASVVDAMEGWTREVYDPASGKYIAYSPNKGALSGHFWVDDDRGGMREAVLNKIETSYMRFVNKQVQAIDPTTGFIIPPSPETRDNVAEIQKHPFLANRMLAGGKSERKAIKKVFAVIEEESRKPLDEQWKRVPQRDTTRLPEGKDPKEHHVEVLQKLDAFLKEPTLEGVIQLRAVSKTSTSLKQRIDSTFRTPHVITAVHGQAHTLMSKLSTPATAAWFYNLANQTRKIVESSGKKNEDGSAPTKSQIIERDAYSMLAEKHVVGAETLHYLKNYLNDASLVLDGFGAIPGVAGDPTYTGSLAGIRMHAAIARDLLHRVERSEPIEAVINPHPMKKRIDELERVKGRDAKK